MIQDDLTRGQKNFLKVGMIEAERSAEPFLDALETLFRTAKVISVGLEDDVNAINRLLTSLRSRIDFRLEHDAWPSIVDENSLASAAIPPPPETQESPSPPPSSQEKKK
jgi:hypothetical protein